MVSASERVAGALALPLSNEERRGLTKRCTENLEAYDLYLKGRYYWNKLIPPEVRKSIQFFQQAIDLTGYPDPRVSSGASTFADTGA